MKKLYLIGGGGHCRSCIDVIEQEGKFQIVGIFDVADKIGETVLGYEVIDVDTNIAKYDGEDVYFLITVGQIKSPELRKKLFNQKIKFATVISPTAYVSKHASIDEGTIIMHQVIVNAGARVGKNCIINTKALIEHDASIEDHCHISTAAVINGGCLVGAGSFIGSNTVLKQGRVVAVDSVISYGNRI